LGAPYKDSTILNGIVEKIKYQLAGWKPVGFHPYGEVVMWEQNEEFWDGMPMDWEMDDGHDVDSLATLDAITEEFYRDQMLARKKTTGNRELLNLKSSVNYGDVSALSRCRKGKGIMT